MAQKGTPSSSPGSKSLPASPFPCLLALRGRDFWAGSTTSDVLDLLMMVANRRFRRDDGTWRRELYKDSRGTQTSSEPTSRNLQSNQKSQVQQRIEVVKKLPVSDLCEKLSGVPSQRPQLSKYCSGSKTYKRGY
ncbi:uncharacterized protein [Miscanthus floridulus]|uniref:uncharacterized protein isoform X3 n=1 Tax=Miscanthus floridulus TaxID=154761 RepID=UPI00345AA555